MPFSSTLVRGSVPAAMALWAISCGGSDYQGVPKDKPALVAPSGSWTWVDVPESKCDDGSPTGFAVNPQDTSDLLIFFEGGGACWDYVTCLVLNSATHGPVGQAEWTTRAASLPAQFDRTRDSNPFRNATMVYIPYCTGDLHAGDNVAAYQGPTTTTTYYHHGRPNTLAYLSLIASTWGNPARVIVSGSSAGGYGATLTYDIARKTYPAARMYLVDDAGTLLEGDAVPAVEKSAWIASWNIGGLIDSLCTGCRTDLSGAYTALTKRYPNDRMALLSSLQDVVIRTYFGLSAADYQTDILQMQADRLAPTMAFHNFFIAGDQHTLLGTMTTSTTQDVVLEPWLDDMINDHTPWMSLTPDLPAP